MIFLTVGTQYPFDRLIQAVDEAVAGGLLGQERLVAQAGAGAYKPKNFEVSDFLAKKDFDAAVDQASAIISHAGIGIISLALDKGKPLLVMPRKGSLGEHVNDHQAVTAREYGQSGHILVAEDEAALPLKIRELATFKPVPKQAKVEEITKKIADFLSGIDL